jgi:hypothetical protein
MINISSTNHSLQPSHTNAGLHSRAHIARHIELPIMPEYGIGQLPANDFLRPPKPGSV